MTNAKPIDLDKEFGFDAALDTPVTTREIEVFGAKIRVVCDLNRFGLLNVIGDDATTSDIMKFLESMIAPADWPTFARLAGNHPALRGEAGDEKLMALIRRIMEVASDPFPTKRPSDLPRTASARSSVRKSPASTASGRAKASTRSR